MTKHAGPLVICGDNLSVAWARVLHTILATGGAPISPLMLSITGFTDDGVAAEDPDIRGALEVMLAAEGLRDVDNVAFTIFPQRYFRMVGGDRHELYDLYRSTFARIQEFNPRNNRRGSYFQRLVDFAGDGNGPNQLEWMLNQYEHNPGARRSKFQATTFDPTRDHTSAAQLEFPCLQQISLTFESDETLTLNAFYATQQLLNKGYGNYLGLSQLGAFMAREMGRRLSRLNVFVGIAKADKISKSSPNVQALLDVVAKKLAADIAAAAPA